MSRGWLIRIRLNCFILVFRVKGSILESTPVQTADLVLIKLTTFVIQISSVCWLTASQSLVSTYSAFAWLLHNFGQFSSFHSKDLYPFLCLYSRLMLAWSWLMHGPTIVLRHVEALSCCNALISYLIIWITFKDISCRLVGISHWLLCNILDEIWSFELIIFKVIHICICHMSIIGNGNTHKVLIGCLSHPIDSNAPGIQLAMWFGQMKIFRTMLCTMCQNYYYIQYATMWLPLHTEVQYLHSRYHY